jgi:hypothetical protein
MEPAPQETIALVQMRKLGMLRSHAPNAAPRTPLSASGNQNAQRFGRSCAAACLGHALLLTTHINIHRSCRRYTSFDQLHENR